MRSRDLTRLNEQFSDSVEPSDEGARAAIGIKLPQWSTLKAEILADFAQEPPYGIRWWRPEPGNSRRILITDQLYCCLASVEGNMTEAGLHWLEFLDASERDGARLADAVKIENGEPTIVPPRPRSPYEQLGPEFIRMHQAGIIRALASALDCLAGVTIGVTGLSQSILRADFRRVLRALERIPGGVNEGVGAQSHFGVRLAAAIADAGPSGWLDWTLDFRNMLVHRGRRIEFGQFLPMEPTLYGADGKPVLRVQRVSHLPRDPGRSDVEVCLDAPWSLVLEENAQDTLEGLIASTQSLINRVGEDLVVLWQWRRDHPRALRQPAEQWLGGRSKESAGFNGYAPGSQVLTPDMAMVHPVVALRFRAAALDDPARPQWDRFD